MQYLTVALAAAALAAPALAAPVSSSVVPSGYEWSVINYEAGCTKTACTYNFLISGPIDDEIPAFNAHCKGTDTGAFAQCVLTHSYNTNSSMPFVYAKMATVHNPNPSLTGPGKIAAQMTFDNGKTEYIYTGHHNAGLNQNLMGGDRFPIYPTAQAIQ